MLFVCRCLQERPPDGGKSCRRGFMGYLIIMSQAIVEASRQGEGMMGTGPDSQPEAAEAPPDEADGDSSFRVFMEKEVDSALAERWGEVRTPHLGCGHGSDESVLTQCLWRNPGAYSTRRASWHRPRRRSAIRWEATPSPHEPMRTSLAPSSTVPQAPNMIR